MGKPGCQMLITVKYREKSKMLLTKDMIDSIIR